MKKINSLLRKCKSLSRQLGRSSSYSSLRSKSTREDLWVGGRKLEEEEEEEDVHHHHNHHHHQQQQQQQHEKVSGSNVIIYVGSTRKRYVISTKYLSHPLVNALIDKSMSKSKQQQQLAMADQCDANAISVRCEVVLFDHLLWMLENSDPNITFDSNLDELADLYVF